MSESKRQKLTDRPNWRQEVDDATYAMLGFIAGKPATPGSDIRRRFKELQSFYANAEQQNPMPKDKSS